MEETDQFSKVTQILTKLYPALCLLCGVLYKNEGHICNESKRVYIFLNVALQKNKGKERLPHNLYVTEPPVLLCELKKRQKTKKNDIEVLREIKENDQKTG